LLCTHPSKQVLVYATTYEPSQYGVTASHIIPELMLHAA